MTFRDHYNFVVCKKEQTKKFTFTTETYQHLYFNVSKDGLSWIRIYTINLGNNDPKSASYTIPEPYSKYAFIKIDSEWNGPWDQWVYYTLNIT